MKPANKFSNFSAVRISNIQLLKGGVTVKGTVEGSAIRDGATYFDIVWEVGPPDCGTGVYAPPGGDDPNDSVYLGGICYKEV